MDKQKRERLILLILVLFFLIMFTRILFGKKPSHPIGRGAVAPKKAATPATMAKAPAAQAPFKTSESADEKLKDPFDLPVDLHEKFVPSEEELGQVVEGVDLPNVNLSGIIWGGETPLAFIGDTVYKIGDTVGNAQISDINRNGVYFLYKGKIVLIRMKKNIDVSQNNRYGPSGADNVPVTYRDVDIY